MTWNHRILTNGNHWWIGEVYYSEDGTIVSWTGGEGILTAWETEDEIRETAMRAAYACLKPVIRVHGDTIAEELL